MEHDFGLEAGPSLTTWEVVQKVDLIIPGSQWFFFLWEAVVNNYTFVNYTICLERLQWYFIVISSYFYQAFKKNTISSENEARNNWKEIFLKDARYSGHQMRTVVCSNLSFSCEMCWKSSPQWGSSKPRFIKLLFAMQMWKPTWSVFNSSSALQHRIQESFGNP